MKGWRHQLAILRKNGSVDKKPLCENMLENTQADIILGTESDVAVDVIV